MMPEWRERLVRSLVRLQKSSLLQTTAEFGLKRTIACAFYIRAGARESVYSFEETSFLMLRKNSHHWRNCNARERGIVSEAAALEKPRGLLARILLVAPCRIAHAAHAKRSEQRNNDESVCDLRLKKMHEES